MKNYLREATGSTDWVQEVQHALAQNKQRQNVAQRDALRDKKKSGPASRNNLPPRGAKRGAPRGKQVRGQLHTGATRGATRGWQ